MDPGRHRWARRLLDLVVYAVGMTLAVTVALVPPSLLAGVGLNGVKYGLFIVGVFSFGYATVLLWPARPGEDLHRDGGRLSDRDGGLPAGQESGGQPQGTRPNAGVDRREDTKFEALAGRVPPLEWYGLAPHDRFHPGTKLYVTSLLMLGVSYAMEVVLGVRA